MSITTHDAPGLPEAPTTDAPGHPPYVGCDGIGHSAQKCPDIRARLFAPEAVGQPYTPTWPNTRRHFAAHDSRISIGFPVKQDTGEYQYPGLIDGAVVAFYRNAPEADLALRNILAAEMPPRVRCARC